MGEFLKMLVRTLERNRFIPEKFASSQEEFDYYFAEAKKLGTFAGVENRIEQLRTPEYAIPRDIISQIITNAFEGHYKIQSAQ